MQNNNFKYASDNIKLILGFKNWTHDVLCKKTGISLITLRRRLKSNNGWSMTEACAIANAFGMTVQELFFTRLIPNGNSNNVVNFN